MKIQTTPLRVIRKGREAERDWLTRRGFDGLYFPGECACEADDLYPCGERHEDCEPGYKGNCTDACTHEGAGEGGWHISRVREAGSIPEPTR